MPSALQSTSQSQKAVSSCFRRVTTRASGYQRRNTSIVKSESMGAQSNMLKDGGPFMSQPVIS